jgi:hypothetical protein
MSILPATIARAVSAVDRDEIVDALYRFGAGQDLRDRLLFDSAFSVEARLDFTGPAKRLGATLPLLVGRKSIGDTIFSTLANLDTTHTVTNPRVTTASGRRCSRWSKRSTCFAPITCGACCSRTSTRPSSRGGRVGG